MNYFLDFIKTTFQSEFQTTMSGDRIASALFVSFLVTLFVILVYRITYQGVAFNRSFTFSLLLLSMVTSVVIMTVTTNLALSLGMVGALSIVRFRTAVKDPTDTVFMFWAITVGIMTGAGLVYISVITNIAMGGLYLLFYLIMKKKTSAPYLLAVRYDSKNAEAAELALHSLQNYKLKSKCISDGVTEICVEIRLKEETLNLIDTLSKIDGVLNVSAVSYGGETKL